jgi:DNA-binding protein YbaB
VINFRYHVVSLAAVFLALAIGLVVGTSALNGPAADELSHNLSQVTKQNSQYRDNISQLEAEAANTEKFASQAAPGLLAGKLVGRRVVVVSMQQSSSYVDDTAAMLQMAGAKVTGEVEIQDSFVDPSNNDALLDLAATTLNTATISGLPANSDGVETSSALLAAVLLDHQPAVASDVTRSVLKAYEEMKYITVSGDVTGPAEAVVVIATPPYTDKDASAENANTVTLVDQFDAAGPIVVGAPGSAGSGNIVGAVTGDAALSKTVSTIDNINTPQGQIAATLALNEQVVLGKTGHYGTSSSASSMLPKQGG